MAVVYMQVRSSTFIPDLDFYDVFVLRVKTGMVGMLGHSTWRYVGASEIRRFGGF